MLYRLHTYFPALAFDAYRLYFYSKVCSDLGTWMQRVVQGFIVYEMTGSPLWVGIIDACQTLPSLFFVFAAGHYLDRHDNIRILRVTQILQCIIGITIAVCLFLGILHIYLFAALAFLFGIAAAVDEPAKMSLPTKLVPRTHVRLAISLNATAFNLARIVGPALGGFAIAYGSPGFAYLANGLSFVPLYLALSRMRLLPQAEREIAHTSIMRGLVESVRYLRTNDRLFGCLMLFASFGFFGWAYTVILPVIAKDILAIDASGLGSLFTAVGVGALVAGLWMGSSTFKIPSNYRMLGGACLYALALVAFALTDTYHYALAFLALMGFGQILQNATLVAQIQLLAPEHMRGRISSIQTFLARGMQALGSIAIGATVEYVEPYYALIVCALCVAATSLLVYHRYFKHTKVHL